MNAWQEKIESEYLPDALELGIHIAKLVRDVYGPARMTEYLMMTECRLAKRLESLHGRIDLDRAAARRARSNVGLFLYPDTPLPRDLTPAAPSD